VKLLSFSLENQPAWKVILRGAAIPGLTVAFCVFVAIVISFTRGWDVQNSIGYGVAAGLFFSLYGGLEMMGAIVFQSKDFGTNLLLAFGYLITWAGCLAIVFRVF